MLDNIVSNAIKYNKMHGGIEILLNADRVEIKDSGIGVNKKDLKNITKRFVRANKSEGGFGIGLDIVNKIVNFYNFKLEITSKENIYTKVVIWFTK